MQILVVVPTYNRQAFVIHTLDGIAAQTRLPSAIVVVDDGSTDDTAHVVTRWMECHPALPACLVRATHSGASAARNLGVARLGEGMDAVAFLDSDDRWPEDFLERTSAALETQPGAVAASTDQEFHFIGKGEQKKRRLADITANPWLWMLRNGAGIGSCTLFRLAAFRAAGGYPEEIPTGHDTVLFGRMAAHGAWLHLPGRPTVMSHVPLSTGSTHHLHACHPDHRVWWAKAAHQCWREGPYRVRFNMKGRKLLSKRWRVAAITAKGLGRHLDAFICLAHAFCLRPWSVKNLLVVIDWRHNGSTMAKGSPPVHEEVPAIGAGDPLPSDRRR
jgi:hypothetical protein